MPSSTPRPAGGEPPGTLGVPRLRRGVRLIYDDVRSRHALLYPEGVRLLNSTAAAILLRCDGTTSIAEIARSLAEEFDGASAADVERFVSSFTAKHLLEVREVDDG